MHKKVSKVFIMPSVFYRIKPIVKTKTGTEIFFESFLERPKIVWELQKAQEIHQSSSFNMDGHLSWLFVQAFSFQFVYFFRWHHWNSFTGVHVKIKSKHSFYVLCLFKLCHYYCVMELLCIDVRYRVKFLSITISNHRIMFVIY